MFRGAKTGATYVGENRVLLKTANGFKMYVDGRDVSIAPHLILDGVWEEWTEAVLRTLLRPGMTVFEVGTNVGFFTLIMAAAVGPGGKIFSFEADAELAQLARDNIEINGLHRTARVVERAAGEHAGTVTFYKTDRHLGGGSIVEGLEQIPHNPSDHRRAVEVAMTTLDVFCKEVSAQPDVLKIDAEGAESAILRGASELLDSKRPLAIVMEFFPRFVRAAGDEPDALLARMEQRGFSLYVIDERRRRLEPVSAQALLQRENAEIVLRR